MNHIWCQEVSANVDDEETWPGILSPSNMFGAPCSQVWRDWLLLLPLVTRLSVHRCQQDWCCQSHRGRGFESIRWAWIGFILPFYQIKPSTNQKVKGKFGQCPNLSSLGIAEGSALAKSTQKTKKTCWQSHRGPDFEIILEFYSSDNRGGTTGFFMPCAPLKTKLGNVYLQRTWHICWQKCPLSVKTGWPGQISKVVLT